MTSQKSDSDDLINKDWVEIGFQSKDPSTDFRGMGLLGLINLNYFTTNAKFNEIGKRTYGRSTHPLHGYSFAIVGINITSWVYKWLSDGSLKAHFYNSSIDLGRQEQETPLEIFNFIYCKSYLLQY